jgi:hypothetical protein
VKPDADVRRLQVRSASLQLVAITGGVMLGLQGPQLWGWS